MNFCWKKISLFLFLLILLPELRVWASEPSVNISCQASWADEAGGIAKIVLKENDVDGTERGIGQTDYIFMVDGSRTTTINDRFLYEDGSDLEPVSAHCPCMNAGHYYLIGGRGVTPLTNTMGYLYGTDEIITWSSSRKIWSDSAGSHYNQSGQRIPIRYQNGCTDIFTIFKEVTVSAIQKIAARRDGSRVAFVAFSGVREDLYGVLNYTTDYAGAVSKIRNAGSATGSLLVPGLQQALDLYSSVTPAKTTKVVILGDGKNVDIDQALSLAGVLRSKSGVVMYSACMGKEAYLRGAGYQAMLGINGWVADRFWSITRQVQSSLSTSLALVHNEPTTVAVQAAEKSYQGEFPGLIWEYYEDAKKGYVPSRTCGTFTKSASQFTWTIPRERKMGSQCSFYLKLKDKAKYISQKTGYAVLNRPLLRYRIYGGSKDQAVREKTVQPPSLSWNPSPLTVTKVSLISGIVFPKSVNTYYIKGGTTAAVSFSSATVYAFEAWKPEINYLHEKKGALVTAVSEVFRERSSNLQTLKSTYHCVLAEDTEVRSYYPQSQIGVGSLARTTEKFDETKKLTLICDSRGPEISGSFPEIFMENTTVRFQALDGGSGVSPGSFCIRLVNLSSGEEKRFTSSGMENSCVLDLKEPFYQGALSWEITVSDRVENRTVLTGTMRGKVPRTEEEMLNEIRTRIL